jgi:hypothetical protein
MANLDPGIVCTFRGSAINCDFMFTSRTGFDPAIPFFLWKTVLVDFDRAHNTVRGILFNVFKINLLLWRVCK